MKTKERIEARRLRGEEGRSIKEIARLVGVSPSSVSIWVRDIDLSAEQRAALLRRKRFLRESFGARHAIRFTNSDPEMARFFVRFLRESFRVADDEISIYCNLFPDHEARQGQLEAFWLERLSLPKSSLRTSTINRYSKYSKRKRLNKLPHGTCRIVVHSTEVVQAMYGAIQELAGFNRPEWLDS